MPDPAVKPHRRVKPRRLIEKETALPALKQAFAMLRPDVQWKNPVMFVVEVGALLTLLFILQRAFGGAKSYVPTGYFIAVDVWLFLTVLFANFATALAEARGKAQADSLRKARQDTTAYRLNEAGDIEEVASTALGPGDRVVVKAGQMIPGDGEIIEGAASINESAITGESAPVIRAAGSDRSGVIGGTLVLSDRIVVLRQQNGLRAPQIYGLGKVRRLQCAFRGREIHAEQAAMTRLAIDLNESPMVLHNSIHRC
jgi:K+-transporting ATPase ATPase B chain